MANANESDFLGEGTKAPQATNIKPRATDPTGLFYLDTGQPTPLYYQRQQNLGQNQTAYVDPTFSPNVANAESAARGGSTSNYKFDGEKGLYYTQKPNGQRIYITNDPAREYETARTPTFTINEAPSAPKDYSSVLTNAAGLAAAGGSVAGPYGAAAGAVTGALAGLPQASGKPLYLTQGDPSQMPGGQRIGTAAEAVQANANYAATGSSRPPGGGTNYFPQIPNTPMPTYTPGAGTNGGSALSTEAQRIIGQAGDLASAGNARAQTYFDQAGAAANRAAPQMAMPSSANQQAVYDRAMGFQAQSGADAIRAERADISGASRLENMQMDMQGVNNLESWRPTNSQQGVDALYGFRPDATYNSANELGAWRADNTAEGAAAVGGFRPEMVLQDAQKLRDFRADRSGIDRLNAYADAPEGPSQAQALLRLQADADKRTQLAMSRSGRGGPAAQVLAQRQAMSEGGLIEAETRGQAAALRAQETDTYKGRQLQALAQAGSLISAAEGQRLQAMAAAGQLMSQADQQKLQAVIAYGELKATQDAQQLSAKQSSGQLNAAGDNMVLGATSNAAALQGQMDSQLLSATGQAAGLRTQQDSIRSNNLQAAGQIRLSGSEINQRGAIAASNADLQAQALNLQSLSLAGQVSSEMRSQDINVLRSNLDAQLQTLGLNDNQVRFFNQLGNDREVASNNLIMQGNAMGLTAQQLQQAQSALNLQWEQFGYGQLSDAQQLQYQYAQLGAQQQNAAATQSINNRTANRADRQEVAGYVGSLFTGLSSLFPTSQSSASSVIAPVSGLSPLPAQAGWGGAQTPPPGGGTTYGI